MKAGFGMFEVKYHEATLPETRMTTFIKEKFNRGFPYIESGPQMILFLIKACFVFLFRQRLKEPRKDIE